MALSWKAVDDAAGRVSDVEREETVAALREDLLDGRLTLDEFSERVGAAYQARTGQELLAVRHDLPAVQKAPLPPASAPVPPPASTDLRRVRGRSRLTLAVFGGVSRRGRFRLPPWSAAAVVFGDLEFDLRDAEVEGRQAVVLVLVVFGNIDIVAAEGTDVDVGGIVVFGSRGEWGHDGIEPGGPRAPSAPGAPAGPTIHVRYLAVFGSVDLWRVPRLLRGSAAQIVRQLRRQEGLPPDLPGAPPALPGLPGPPGSRRRRRR